MPKYLSAAELFDACRPLVRADAAVSPYLANAWRHKLENYRVLTNQEVITGTLYESLPEHLVGFVNDEQPVMVIASGLGQEPLYLVLRSTKTKKFYGYGTTPGFYGLDGLPDDFKFGDPVILVEGTLDRDVLHELGVPVLATLTAGLTRLQQGILSLLTDRVGLLYDADEVGQRARARDKKRLSEAGLRVLPLSQYRGCKDPGDLLKLGDRFDQDLAMRHYRAQAAVLAAA